MEEINITDIVQNQYKVPELDNMVADIKTKNPIDKTTTQDVGYDFGGKLLFDTGLKEKTQKPSLSFQNTNVEDAFANVGGEWLSKYPTYKRGRDNAEFAGQNQTTGEKWVNGVEKALLKTGNAVVGGTAGIVYGLGSALSNGNFSSLYDNDFSNKLADLDAKLGYQLPNYYTKQEQEKGLFGQMGTANFWSDKFLGGLSFTAGAIISEAIWAYATGGTSLATIGVRRFAQGARIAEEGVSIASKASLVARETEAITKYSQTLKNLGLLRAGEISKDTAIAIGKTGEVLSTTGFMLRSAGYEASVEALQYKREAKDNFYRNFESQNGRTPEASEIAEFEKNLEAGANTVFGVNMGILGVSNLAMFGHTFGFKSPINTGIGEFIEKKAFGVGMTKTADGTFKVLEATRPQKIVKGLTDYVLKPGFTEGLFEEGGQGVTTKYNNAWIEHTYDTNKSNQNFDAMGAMYDSVAEQYGTKEGWVENGLGILIGIVGGGSNVYNENKAEKESLEYKASVANTYTDAVLQPLLLGNKIQVANRMQGFSEEAKIEAQNGNLAKSALAEKSAILTHIDAKQTIGEDINDTLNELSQSMDRVTPEQWRKAGITDIATHKEETLAEYKSLSEQWKKNNTYWQYMIGKKLVGEQNLGKTSLESAFGKFNTNTQIVKALAWQSTVGENAHKQMQEVKTVLGRELGEIHANTLGQLEQLRSQDKSVQDRRYALRTRHETLIATRDRLTQLVETLNNAPKETEGNTKQGDRRAKVVADLLRTNTEIEQTTAELENIASNINSANAQSQGLAGVSLDTNLLGSTLTGQDLLDLENNLDKFKSSLEYTKQINPQKYQYLNDLLNEYSQVDKIFRANQATQKVITSSDFKMENIGGWISSKVKGKKAMNENTQEWLQEAINAYSNSKTGVIADSVAKDEIIADEIVEKQPDNKTAKVRTAEELLEQERQEKLAKVRPITSKQNSLEVEKADIEEDKFNREFSQKIDQLNNFFTNTLGLSIKFDGSGRRKLDNGKEVVTYEITIYQNGKVIGNTGFKIVNGKVEISLTEINEELQGKGVASVLYQDINNALQQLGYGVLHSDTTFLEDSRKQKTFLIVDGKELSLDETSEFLLSLEDPLEDLEKLKEEGRVQEIKKIKPGEKLWQSLERKGLAEKLENGQYRFINAKYDAELKALEEQPTQTVSAPQTTTRTVINQAEIDRINKEYDDKIKALNNTQSENKVEQYKQRIKDIFKSQQLEYTGDYTDYTEPTQAEIEEFRELNKTADKGLFTERYNELKDKLSQWKALDSYADQENQTIADLIIILNQLEQEVEQEQTKDEHTQEDIPLTTSDFEGSSDLYVPELLMNVDTHAKVKKPAGTQNYRISHIKLNTIVGKLITEDNLPLVEGKEVTFEQIENLKPGQTLTISGVNFKLVEGGAIEVSISDFNSLSQSLNMFVLDTKDTNWSYKDLIMWNGVNTVKVPSDFSEPTISQEAIYSVKEGDKVSYEIGNEDGWNVKNYNAWQKAIGTKKEAEAKAYFEKQIKIYAVNSKGERVGVLKATKDSATDVNFLRIKQRAVENFNPALEKTNLMVTTTVSNLYLGSPQVNIVDGQVVNLPFTDKAITQVVATKAITQVVATGFMEGEEVTTNRVTEDVDTSFIEKIAKKNPGKQVPFVVVKKGSKNIAYPITMVKKANPKVRELDSILNQNIEDKDKVIAINNLIQQEQIEIEKLGFADIQDSNKMQEVRTAFENKQTFLSAVDLADSKYKIPNLKTDAQINIDLEDLDNAISDPKIRVSFEDENVIFSEERDVKNNTLTEVENTLNELALELYNDYVSNADTKYLDSKGNILEDTLYTDTFDESPIEKVTSQLAKIGNINILKRAFSAKLPKIVENALGADKVREVKNMIKQYDFILKQTIVKPGTAQNGANNIC